MQTVTVASTSSSTVNLGVRIVGIRSGNPVDSGLVSLNPATVKRGTTVVQVIVDLSKLPEDVYIATIDCGPSAVAKPSSITFTRGPS